MSQSTRAATKVKGKRPPAPGTPIQVRLQPSDLAALDAFVARHAEPTTRPQAIRVILADWLRTHGLTEPGHPEPTGPATDLIKRMDAEIEEHRRGNNGKRADAERAK